MNIVSAELPMWPNSQISEDEILESFSDVFDRRRLTLEEVKSVFLDADDGEVMSSLRPQMQTSANEPMDALLPRLQLADVLEPRMQLPTREEFRVSLDILYKLLKNLIGKDLTKLSLPVFLNEPLSLSQKTAEMMFYNELLDKAGKQTDSIMRMAYVAAWAISGNMMICGRTDKPFNPMLGETFELVTPEYRYIAE